MKDLRVLLCCGAGFSSGLLAQKARKIAKKMNIAATIEARSESQVSGYLEKIDVLLLGPHYRNELESFTKLAKPYGVLVAVIPDDIYGMIDGQGLIELAKKLHENQEQ